MAQGDCSEGQSPGEKDRLDLVARLSGSTGKIDLPGQQDRVGCLVDRGEEDLSDGIDETTEMFWEIVDPLRGRCLGHDPVAMWRREQYE